MIDVGVFIESNVIDINVTTDENTADVTVSILNPVIDLQIQPSVLGVFDAQLEQRVTILENENHVLTIKTDW